MFLMFFTQAPARGCDEDDLYDYSTHHLLVICTPQGDTFVQNKYYEGKIKCGDKE